MSQFFETATRHFACSSLAIAPHLRVKIASGVLALAGIDDVGIGTAEARVLSTDTIGTVRLWTAQGTRKMVAAGAIPIGADVYAAASGKVNDVGGGVYIGVAMHATSADGDVIEVLPCREPGGNVTHHTASATLTRAQRNSIHTNLGAAGAITLTLPQDAVKGDKFQFNAMAAQELRVDPGAAGAVYISGAKQTDDKYVSFDDEAEQLTLTADGNGDWIAGPSNGTFSVEA